MLSILFWGHLDGAHLELTAAAVAPPALGQTILLGPVPAPMGTLPQAFAPHSLPCHCFAGGTWPEWMEHPPMAACWTTLPGGRGLVAFLLFVNLCFVPTASG